MVVQAWKHRNRFSSSKTRDNATFTCGFLAFLAALFLCLALINGAVSDAHRQITGAHKQMRHVRGVVASRGPYAGDAAYVSYRLVTVTFPRWDHQTTSVERMMSWDTRVGQRIDVLIHRDGRSYISNDLNPEENFWHVNTGEGSRISGYVFLSLLAWIATWTCFYTLWLMYRYRQWRKPVVQAA